MTSRRGRRPLLSVASLALAVLAFAAAELAVRGLWTPAERFPEFDGYLLDACGPFFRLRSAWRGPELVQAPRHRFFPAAQALPLAKGRAFRVIVLGESSARELGAAMQRLAGSDPRFASYQVVNMAIGASTLELSQDKLSEALRYDPDAVVVLFGNNLFFRLPPCTPDRLAKARVHRWAARSRIIDLLARRLSAGDPARTFDQYESQDVPKRVAAMRRFLTALTQASAARKFRLVLCTVPENLWYPPDDPRDSRDDPRFLELEYRFAIGERSAAISALKTLCEREPRAWWEFRLGAWLYGQGRYAEAADSLKRAKDLDPDHDRVREDAQESVRAAASRAGAPLLDFQRIVSDQGPHGIADWCSFSDGQHVVPSLFDREALLVLTRLSGAGSRLSEETGAHGILSLDGALRSTMAMIPLSQAPRNEVFSYVAQFYARDAAALSRSIPADIASNDRDRARLLVFLAEGLWRSGQSGQALLLNERAARLAPELEAAARQRGIFALELGRRDEALAWLRNAAVLDPSAALPRYFLSRLAGKPKKIIQASGSYP